MCIINFFKTIDEIRLITKEMLDGFDHPLLTDFVEKNAKFTKLDDLPTWQSIFDINYRMPKYLECDFEDIITPYAERFRATIWCLEYTDGSKEVLIPTQNRGTRIRDDVTERVSIPGDEMPKNVHRAMRIVLGTVTNKLGENIGYSWKLYQQGETMLTRQEYEQLVLDVAKHFKTSPVTVNLLEINDNTLKEVLSQKQSNVNIEGKFYPAYKNDDFTVIVANKDMTQAIVYGNADLITKEIGIEKYTGFPINGDGFTIAKNAFIETMKFLNLYEAGGLPRGIRKLVAYRHDIVFDDVYQKNLTKAIQEWKDSKEANFV